MLMTGCVAGTRGFRSELASYQGDGQIEDTSLRFAAFPSNGFRLVLPSFQSERGDEHVYRLGILPATKGSVLFFRLALSDDARRPLTHSVGFDSITVELLDEMGRGLYRETVKSSELRPDPRTGEADFGAAPFSFSSATRYDLRLRLTPAHNAPPLNLSLVLRSGGFK